MASELSGDGATLSYLEKHTCNLKLRKRWTKLVQEPMRELSTEQSEVDRFVIEEIESVPHLEALLLLWNNKHRRWSTEEMADDLYLSPQQTIPILLDLSQRKMIITQSDLWSYNPGYHKSSLVDSLDQIYRRNIVRISTLIHSKPSASARAFARAFRLAKD